MRFSSCAWSNNMQINQVFIHPSIKSKINNIHVRLCSMTFENFVRIDQNPPRTFLFLFLEMERTPKCWRDREMD